MECPQCQTSIPVRQKYCGVCGHKLESTCAQCQAVNPAGNQYCGQCGASLASADAMTLARSGLIHYVPQKILDLLGLRQPEMLGKPFSLFIERDELVIFYSHLNTLLSRFEKQTFEIALKHKEKGRIYVLLECTIGKRSQNSVEAIHITLTETTKHREASAQLQHQQDLLGLVFGLANDISTVYGRHLDHAVENALRKIGLFTEADHCCIYSINRSLKRLDRRYHWTAGTASAPLTGRQPASVPLGSIKRTLVRLVQEQTVVIDHANACAPAESAELREWLKAETAAVVLHVIYVGKHPVAIICAVRERTDSTWDADSVALIKYFGQFTAARLPSDAGRPDVSRDVQLARTDPIRTNDGPASATAENVIAIGRKREDPRKLPEGTPDRADEPGTAARRGALPDMTRPMLLEALDGGTATDQQPVFPRDDGLVLLTCPHCGCRESVSVGQFDKLGNAIRVQCPCSEEFTAVLEKRKSYRKVVQLNGYFSLSGDLGAGAADGSIWGPMVVKDLSKAGLRFYSEKAALLKPGDLLMVRFNLDNSNNALIHKPARVVSAAAHEVGCRFEGSDSYDITLGFYFI